MVIKFLHISSRVEAPSLGGPIGDPAREVVFNDAVGESLDGSISVENLLAENRNDPPDSAVGHFEHVVLQVLAPELNLLFKNSH